MILYIEKSHRVLVRGFTTGNARDSTVYTLQRSENLIFLINNIYIYIYYYITILTKPFSLHRSSHYLYTFIMENRGETSRRALLKPWTPQEEVALAQSFLSISEDGEVGNNQRHQKF